MLAPARLWTSRLLRSACGSGVARELRSMMTSPLTSDVLPSAPGLARAPAGACQLSRGPRLPCVAERSVPRRAMANRAAQRMTSARADEPGVLTSQRDKSATAVVDRNSGVEEAMTPGQEVVNHTGAITKQPVTHFQSGQTLKPGTLPRVHPRKPEPELDTRPPPGPVTSAVASSMGHVAASEHETPEEPDVLDVSNPETSPKPRGGHSTPKHFPLFKLPEDVLPKARIIKVRSAEFVKSSADVAQCPKDSRPEIAVIGRSNVGKSSLINMLTNRKGLAQTSKKPGKTQLINHFLINEDWYLVDLPGYGYAVAPGSVRDDWHAFTQKYFLSRPNLISVLLLVDASIPPMQVDLDCADWMGQNKIPVTVVFTKCDRRKKQKNGGRPPAENVADFERQLGEVYEEPPPWIMTSAVLATGKDVLLGHISQLIRHWKT